MNRGEIFKYYDDDTVVKTLRVFKRTRGFHMGEIVVAFYDITDDRRRTLNEDHKTFLRVYDRIQKKP